MTSGADRLRPAWGSLPLPLRTRILEAIGGPFISDAPAHGGFSAGYAGIVTTAARSAFVKACAAEWHSDSLRFLREEIFTIALLPSSISPTVVAAIDTEAGAALVLESIDGRHPGSPWTPEDLHAVAASMAHLAQTRAPSNMLRAEDRMVPGFTRWSDIAESAALLDDLPPAVRARLPELRRLELDFRAAVSGDTIVHQDLRADNILIRDGRAHLLDWPHARRGAAWVDLPCLLPSIEASGGPLCEDAWRVFQEHGAPPAEEMLTVISGFASFLWYSQGQPEIPQLPGLRAFQRMQALPALRWLTGMLSDAASHRRVGGIPLA